MSWHPPTDPAPAAKIIHRRQFGATPRRDRHHRLVRFILISSGISPPRPNGSAPSPRRQHRRHARVHRVAAALQHSLSRFHFIVVRRAHHPARPAHRRKHRRRILRHRHRSAHRQQPCSSSNLPRASADTFATARRATIPPAVATFSECFRPSIGIRTAVSQRSIISVAARPPRARTTSTPETAAANRTDPPPPAPVSIAAISYPRARSASTAARRRPHVSHGTVSSVPSAVFEIARIGGRAVIPHRIIRSAPAPSIVRNIAPTLYMLRTLSSSIATGSRSPSYAAAPALARYGKRSTTERTAPGAPDDSNNASRRAALFAFTGVPPQTARRNAVASCALRLYHRAQRNAVASCALHAHTGVCSTISTP